MRPGWTGPLSQLRAEAMARAEHRCEWPGCDGADWLGLQLAHLEHRGMGGNPALNTLEDVTILCAWHHDILDGRTVQGRRREVSRLLGACLGRAR